MENAYRIAATLGNLLDLNVIKASEGTFVLTQVTGGVRIYAQDTVEGKQIVSKGLNQLIKLNEQGYVEYAKYIENLPIRSDMKM